MGKIFVTTEERLFKIEKISELIKSEQLSTIQSAYENAIKTDDEEYAADMARLLRNKLLSLSDKEVTLDRVNLDTFNATSFLISLENILTGDWAQYRKALRDLPEQDGFPFDIDWPETPNK